MAKNISEVSQVSQPGLVFKFGNQRTVLWEEIMHLLSQFE